MWSGYSAASALIPIFCMQPNPDTEGEHLPQIVGKLQVENIRRGGWGRVNSIGQNSSTKLKCQGRISFYPGLMLIYILVFLVFWSFRKD